MEMYEKLELKLRRKDVLVLWTGAMIHPEFLKALSTYNIYVCSDDPESSAVLSTPVAPHFDYAFTRNIACVDNYKKWGCRNVKWLCPAFDPDFSDPNLTAEKILSGERSIDIIMFCERVSGFGNRPQRIERLYHEFPQAYIRGKGWPGGFVRQEEMVAAYRNAKIGWNLHLSVGPTNSRLAALPAFGVMEICDNKAHLAKIFTLDEEIVGFDTINECIDKTRYYLAHDRERREIAARGWQRVTTDFTELREWERVLSCVAPSLLAKRSVQQPLATTWPGIIHSPRPNKLHLGCGCEYLPGYINIDCDPAAKADLHLDMMAIDNAFAPGSIDEILMIHSFNYLSLWQARDFLKKTATLLSPEGTLIIETPNLLKAVDRIIAHHKGSTEAYLEGVRALHAFGMDQIERRESFTPYAFSWSPWHLELELREAGFAEISLLPPQTHAPWRDMRIEARPGRTAQETTSNRRLLIVADSAMGHATIRVRGSALTESLRARGWGVELVDVRQIPAEEIITKAGDVDVVYLLKVSLLDLIRRIKETPAVVVFDLSDALWTEFHRQHGWQDIDAILGSADAIISDNPYVARYGKRFTENVHVVPTATYVERFAEKMAYRPAKPANAPQVIGWLGSQGTAGGLNFLKGCLERLAVRHQNLELRIVGADHAAMPEFANLPTTFIPIYDEERMIEEVLAFDIGLFPPPLDLDDYIVRGALKAMIYMSGGVPAVCYRAGESADLIEDGVTGMLAESQEEWEQKIEQLILSPELRSAIGKKALQAVCRNHSLKYVADNLISVFENILILDRNTAEDGKIDRPAGQTGRSAMSPRGGSPVRNARPRILLLADVPNWIFARHCRMLQRYLSDEFDFTIRFMGDRFNEEDFTLIYPLEWVVIEPGTIRDPRKYITGIRSHLWWPDRDFNEFTRFLLSKFNRVHVVSRRLFDIFEPALPGVAYVTHGVDTEFFKPSTSTDQSGNRVRVGWAGNRNSDARKGFAEIIEPLGKLRGVELVFCGYIDCNLSLDEMRSFYDSLDIYVCASDLEGNNNSLMEAASMARAIITTDNGTVPEYLHHGENALIVDRSPEDFIQAVETLRDDPALRVRLGKGACEAIKRSWNWRDKAEDYRRFFKEAITAAQSDIDSGAARPSIRGEEHGHRPPQRVGSAEKNYEIIQMVIGAGMHAQAIQALENLTEDCPDFAPAHHLLASLYRKTGKIDLALRSHERAVDLDPDNVVYLKDHAGFLIAETGGIEKALGLLHRALAAQPTDIETMLMIGNLCAVQGRYRDATFFYEAVRKLEPGNRVALENLNALSAMACGASPGTAAEPAEESGRLRNPLTASPGQSGTAGGPAAANHRHITNLQKADEHVRTGAIDLDSYPYQVHFLMIDKCNVKCIMCGGDYFKSKSGRMITLEKFKTMAANLKLENARAIVLAGAGDPLLNKDLVRIIQFVKSTYPHINISVTTNGLALTARLSGLLLDSGVGLVNISINSATRTSYRRIMQVDGFDAVCRNAKSFVEQRNRSSRPTALQFSAAINRLNIEELPRLVELAKEIGVNSINLFYTRFYPERIRHLNIDDPADRLVNEASLFFHQKLSDEMVLKAKGLARQYRIHLTHEPLFREHAPPCKCTWPMTQIMVGFDGEIYPCGGSEIHFREKVEKGIYNFGNVLQSPVDAFWNSEIYRALRISSRHRDTCPIQECNCCANTISPNDIRSHIMQWDEAETVIGLQPSDTARGLEPLRTGAEQPLVSVIVPTFNRPHMLINALKSIFGQTYQSYEVIVVNDGGSDVRDLFEGLPSDSIRYLQHETNRGLPAARNTGIKAARGKYIAYLDDDDLFYPDHLETLVYFLESAEHVVAYTDAHRTFQEMQNGKYVTSKKDVPYSINFDYELILKENFIPVLCIMHRKSCVESVGLFDETLQSHEDWDLWMRMSRRFRFAHIPVVTCSFSWRQDGSTMTSGGPQKMHESRVIVSQRGKEYQRTGMIHPDTMERSGYASIDYPAIRELLHSQRKGQAFAELQEYLAKFPNHAEAHGDLGSLYCEKGEKGKALHHYEKAVALDPKNIIALRSLADFYYVEMKKIDDAVCLYKKILSIKPEDVDALCVLGNLSMERQAFDSARQYYLQALLIDPTNEPAGTMMDALDSKGLGSAAAESPDIALLEARRLVRKGETGRAIIKLETLIRLHPKEAGAHNDLGNLYCLQNEIEKALFHLDRAVQLQPDVLRFVKDLADAHLAEAANVSEALQLFNRALALKPDDVDTLLRIGNLCAVQQQFDDAQFFYNRVLSIEPGNAQAGENLAVLQRMSEGKPRIRQSPDGDSTVQEKGNHRERVSIVILTFNKLEYTKKCVESIRRHTPEHHEIIFVDNGSTAETVQWLQKLVRENGHYKLIENKTNLGFAKGCNQGAHVASGNYLLFLNNDTEPQAGWLEPLVNVLERDPSVAAVGSRLLFPDGTIQHAGVLILDDRKLPDPLVARHIYYGHASDMAEANQAKVYQALTGACILVRREAFNQVEGFDEEYWNGYEDIDFCFKLQEKECIIVYQPASVLIHHESKSGTERFTKTHENIKRLHIKWIGKIKPDAIIENNGTLRWNRLPHHKSYFAPTDYKEELQRNSSHNKNNLVSIVILACNQQKFTKECVESIQKHTPEPHEIIFVDNGSIDGTVKWLKKIIKNNSNYKMIENKKNLGFSRGCNQGIEAARGERILLLNNDVVVTENWLTGMLECLNSAPDIGIVGPMTNSISGPQKVPVVGYASIDGLAEYALAFRQKNRHRRIPCRRIVGFCMLFNRRLIEEVGLLDESFGSGNFEDDDFCLRAYLKGYRNLIAGDVFIHHYGSRTFIGNRIDYGSSLTGNREIYASKWRAIEQEAEQGRKIRALVAREQGGERLQRGDVKGAVDLYLAAIRQCPDDPHTYRDLAASMIQVKRYQDALDALKAGPAGDTDVQMLTLDGYCKEGLNDLAAAETLAMQALSKGGCYAPALNLKGILSHKKGLLMEAEEYFKKAILQDPSYGEPFTNLGVLKWTAGERDAAFDLLERGFILSPDGEDIADRYHAAATALEAFVRAENLFREAKAIYPSNRHIAFLLIDLLISQDKHAEAMEEIESAMAAFDVDDGFIAAALEVRNILGPLEIKKKAKGETLSLCMIVKNEERNLVRCLSSVKSAVDEIIVVDTGSTDRTKELAAAFGAKVFDFDWDEDFSSARNFSLSRATGDWILVIDADETVSSRDHETIRDFIKKSPAGTGGYYLTTRNYVVETNTAGWVANDGSYRGEEAGTGWYASRKVRLFRNDPRIRFSGDVHELVEAAMQNAGMKIAECGVPVHHTGKLDRASVLEKGERYYLLGLKKIEESGGTPRAILELAIQAGELGRYDDAIALWRRCLKGSPGQDGMPGLRESHQCLPQCGSLRRGARGSQEGRRSGERNEGAPSELRRRRILRRRSPQGHQDGGENPEKGTGLSPCPGPSCHLTCTGRSRRKEHREPAAAS